MEQHTDLFKLGGWPAYRSRKKITYANKDGEIGASFAPPPCRRTTKIYAEPAKDEFFNASWIMSEAVLDAECKAFDETVE